MKTSFDGHFIFLVIDIIRPICLFTVLVNIFGTSYGSEKEKKIEQETDTMRNFRDTLAIGVLQWEDSVEDLRTASESTLKGIASWKSIKKQ